MEIYENIDLSKKCTFHIGGVAARYYEPENETELIALASRIYAEEGKVYVLSGGSNLLINDKKTFPNVVSMKNACTDFVHISGGEFYIGASVRIQKVIQNINNFGYGGIEELIGLPAMLGGCIYMNAGIGGEYNSRFVIGQFIEKVKVYCYETKALEWIEKEDCKFSHRKSIFQSNEYLILGAKLLFYEQPIDISKERISKRRQFCSEHFEYGKGCFGTCFSKSSRKALMIAAKSDLLYKGNVYQSSGNVNWLVNNGNGTYEEAMHIINRCIGLHKLINRPIECEVRIWD